MAVIHVLDSETIDKIAAGEVVERPASIVKELVENAIDAGADAITVEAKEGGIEFIRVTDNGSGVEQDQIRTAFLRHATSKIQTAEDLSRVLSLGFRGEALSSIAAVSKVELITKTREKLTGNRMLLEGAVEKEFQEIGAPDGTTLIVRNLFYNTPVRRKFLKQPATEGGYIAELMEHLAISRPDISFKFVLGNQTRFHTSGNGDLREVIYRVYGREIAQAIIPVQVERHGIKVEGFLGKPILVRSNRNFEMYYINGRFIKSNVLARAIEEGYKEYLMQHKFPFCVLHITMDPQKVDVNVHPTKMDVRFSDGFVVAEVLSAIIKEALRQKEMIPKETVTEDKGEKEGKVSSKIHTPEPFEKKRNTEYRVEESARYQKDTDARHDFKSNPVWKRVLASEEDEPVAEKPSENPVTASDNTVTASDKSAPTLETNTEEFFFEEEPKEAKTQNAEAVSEEVKQEETIAETKKNPEKEPKAEQLNLFEERIISADNRSKFRIIGQVFDTYWMIQYEEQLLIVDQHAAHEKVKYERFMKQFREKQICSQTLMPPIIVSLTGQEEIVLKNCMEQFQNLGFEIEEFGGNEYTLRSVPVDLYGCDERELFLEVLDELSESTGGSNPRVIEEKIASMSCKAAVKGNNRLSYEEANELIDELLTLDNPYNCPHGRPTIITISKYEMEKKFKRIV